MLALKLALVCATVGLATCARPRHGVAPLADNVADLGPAPDPHLGEGRRAGRRLVRRMKTRGGGRLMARGGFTMRAGFQGNHEEDEDEDEQSLGESSSQCATQSAQVAKLTEALAKERERTASRRESSVMLEISEATRSTKPCEAEHAELLALKRRMNHQFDTALHASEGSQLEGRGLQRLLAPEGPRGGSRRGVKLGAAQGAHGKALWGQSRNVSVARLLEQLKQRTEALQHEAAEVKKLKAELQRQKQHAAKRTQAAKA